MYQITIKEIKKEGYTQKEYQLIADSGNVQDGGAIYDYVKTDSVRKAEKEIFSQSVEDINLTDIILAINMIKK